MMSKVWFGIYLYFARGKSYHKDGMLTIRLTKQSELLLETFQNQSIGFIRMN